MRRWNVSWDFSASLIGRAPDLPGVYVLTRNDEVVFCGQASGTATIRSRLKDHLEGRERLHGSRVTHCRWEVCSDPARRCNELLEEHSRRFGKLPCCNV
jgi:hypothetical protein